MTNVIETGGECDCTTAEDFLDKLSPRHAFWNDNPLGWIFRGQDGDWPLLPKAFRKDAYAEFGISYNTSVSAGLANASAQRQLIMDFRRRLDASGLPIPIVAPDPYNQGHYPAQPGNPQPDAFPQQALAQHLGLPTPLLDWTTKPAVAAYFAAPKKTSAEPKMVVWALRRDFIESGYQQGDTITNTFDHFVVDNHWAKIETAPRSSNPNLHAQSGLFTMLRGIDGHLWPLDAIVERLVKDKPARMSPFKAPLMRKLTLPTSVGQKLLWRLAHEGIDGASMFPGYDGIVKAMREKVLAKP